MHSKSDKTIIPYGHQWIDQDDIDAVAECLRGDWLTQGPRVEQFEKALCEKTGAAHAVAVSSGTAALHLAVLGLGLQAGDCGVCPAIAFVADANCIAYAGGNVSFADVDPTTALIDVQLLEEQVARLVGAGTPPRVIVPVDMCGQAPDLPAIRRIADCCGAKVIEDAAHALGGQYEHDGQTYNAGCCAHSDAAVLSFHPVKHVTTAEGGAVLTNDAKLAQRIAELRSHGIHKDPARLSKPDEGPWYYEQEALGFNYRISDVQCALGLSQLSKLDRFVARRNEIAAVYDTALASAPLADRLEPLQQLPGRRNAYHLYVIHVKRGTGESLEGVAHRRKQLYQHLVQHHISPQVHYIPVHWQPYYRRRYSTSIDDCPGAGEYYAGCLSLPMYAALSDSDVTRVIDALLAWT